MAQVGLTIGPLFCKSERNGKTLILEMQTAHQHLKLDVNNNYWY